MHRSSLVCLRTHDSTKYVRSMNKVRDNEFTLSIPLANQTHHDPDALTHVGIVRAAEEVTHRLYAWHCCAIVNSDF